jgi:hypothetical protein
MIQLVALHVARPVCLTARALSTTMRNGRAAFEVSSLAYLVRNVPAVELTSERRPALAG